MLTGYRPRPDLPFSYATLKNGEKRLLWTTFTKQQIDINVHHPQGQAYLKQWLAISPRNAITVLDTHDGFGVLDSGAEGTNPGLIPAEDLDALVERMYFQ